MRVVIPFDPHDPKTRLSEILTSDERYAFAKMMLEDVTIAVKNAGLIPEILSTEIIESQWKVIVDGRPLSVAVNSVLENSKMPIAIVMSDLAIATAESIRKLIESEGEISIVPGNLGGTNAFVTHREDFRVNYHGASYLDHVKIAEGIGANVTEVDSFRLATDIDVKEDLIEILIHGKGKSQDWLIENGFRLEVHGKNRVGIHRGEKR
jgi:2-phospho-L-lactate guanylyltransferase